MLAVARNGAHRFAKHTLGEIELVEGFGVTGDAHAGATVQQRFERRKNAAAPNLRQVHLIHGELFDEVASDGFVVAPGELGENVTTRGLDLLALPESTVLRLGEHAAVRLTGLRSPCVQIDRAFPGLMKRLLPRDATGTPRPIVGVMSVVLVGGLVRTGDAIRVELPLTASPLRPI